MSRTPSIMNIPSIQNIILEDKTANFDKQVKQLFRPQSYNTFPINDLLKHINYKSDQRFYILVKELEDWNTRVEKKIIQRDGRAQLYRNTFLFSSLKNIMVQNSKGTKNYEINMNKLYEWWRINSKNQIPMYFSSKKRCRQDQDWQVRKTFKSNMPLQIKNYERRIMFTSSQNYGKFHTEKAQVPSHDKLVDYSGIKEYKSKQSNQRQVLQESQINYAKTLLKTRQGRLNQDHSHNSQFFMGKFDNLSKTTTFFNKDRQKSIKTAKNSPSLSFLQQHTDQIENIKKYRLNYALTKKGPFFRERDVNMNKTTKSYATLKPFDLTTSDIDQNLLNFQKSALVKQISINYDDSNNSVLKQERQDTDEQFMAFTEIKNWNGQMLMTNPFESKIKKQLIKKKKQ